MNTLQFSVLIANYNRANFIEEAIQSVLKQDFQNWELVILDDHSTDHSLSLIQKYTEKDDRIRYEVNSTNLGVGETKKRLIEMAKGEICAFLDSDDALLPEALSTCYQAHQLHPETIVYSQHYITDENLFPLKLGSSRRIPKHSTHLSYFGISHLASFKRKDYLQTEGLDASLTKAIDQDLYYKLEEVNGQYFIEKPLYLYRHNGQSISLNEGKEKATALKHQIQNKALSRRKEQNLNAPSSRLMNAIQFKELNKFNEISFFTRINYYIYQLKTKIQLWLPK